MILSNMKFENDMNKFMVVHSSLSHDDSSDVQISQKFQSSAVNMFRTTRINVNGILIEYEGEDSGIGLLFASKAAVQVVLVMMVLMVVIVMVMLVSPPIFWILTSNLLQIFCCKKYSFCPSFCLAKF